MPVEFQAGTVRLKVVALFGASGVLPANFIVTPDAFVKGGLTPLDSLLYVTKDPGADADAVRRQVDRIIAPLPTVTVKDPGEFAQEQRQQINLFLYFIYALLGLAVVIAVLGIINTLALSVIERTREVGLLRAVGLSRRQLRLMVRLESVVVAVLGAVLGVVMGLVFGVMLQRAIADQGIDVLVDPVAAARDLRRARGARRSARGGAPRPESGPARRTSGHRCRVDHFAGFVSRSPVGLPSVDSVGAQKRDGGQVLAGTDGGAVRPTPRPARVPDDTSERSQLWRARTTQHGDAPPV